MCGWFGWMENWKYRAREWNKIHLNVAYNGKSYHARYCFIQYWFSFFFFFFLFGFNGEEHNMIVSHGMNSSRSQILMYAKWAPSHKCQSFLDEMISFSRLIRPKALTELAKNKGQFRFESKEKKNLIFVQSFLLCFQIFSFILLPIL